MHYLVKSPLLNSAVHALGPVHKQTWRLLLRRPSQQYADAVEVYMSTAHCNEQLDK